LTAHGGARTPARMTGTHCQYTDLFVPLIEALAEDLAALRAEVWVHVPQGAGVASLADRLTTPGGIRDVPQERSDPPTETTALPTEREDPA
jgi:hypothetical protein